MDKPQRWSHEDDRQADTQDLGDEHDTTLPVDLPSLEPLSRSQALLDPESSKEWDVDAFLLSRSDLPLDELRSELREYLTELREELGVLINDEYEEFISLGLGLRGEAEQLEEIRIPLQVMKNEVESIRSTFQKTQSSLEGLLAERTSLREEKSVLDLLTHLTETLERTENLLGIRRDAQDLEDEEPADLHDGLAASAHDDRGRGRSSEKVAIKGASPNIDSSVPTPRPKLSVRIASSTEDTKLVGSGLPKRDIKMLRRTANEYSQLVYLTAKAKKEECAYVTAGREGADVENRIDTLKSTLNAHLAAVFSEIIKSLSDISRRAQQQRLQRDQIQYGDIKTQLMDCLEVYEMIGGWREAEEVLRQFVKREAQQLITSRALTSDRLQDLAPATPFPLSMKNSTNALSPTMSIKTPHTPNFGEEGATTVKAGADPADASSQGVHNEDVNVFESTLSLPNNGGIAATGTSKVPSDVEDSRILDGPKISYVPESGTGGNLGAIYNALLRYIEYELRPVIDAANILRQRTKTSRHGKLDFAIPSEVVGTAGSATPSAEAADLPKVDDLSLNDNSDNFEFVGRVIWVEIGERILSEIGNAVFAAGRVAQLHQNYILTHHFLSQLELLSGSIHSVALVRASETYQVFGKRWQLPIYFQLRWKEIVVALEDALSKGIISVKAGPKDSYTLPQSAAVMAAVRACWAPTTYIPELGHRFLRLTLQILSRYRNWLEKSVPALYSPSSAALVGNTGSTSAARQSMTISRSTTPQPVGNAAMPQGDPASDSAAAIAEDNLLKISSMVAFDLTQIQKDVKQFWATDVAPELESYLEDTDFTQVNAALQHSLAEFESLSQSPATQIQQILTRRCTDPLKLIRSVASQLRATTLAPTPKEPEPSHFIGGILKPLRDYFASNGPGDGLSQECRQAWSQNIVSEVVASYTSILISVRKTEDLLRRHRKGKKTGFSLFGSSTNTGPSVEEEEQRFKQQMTADIMALAKEAEKLGIRMGTAEASQIPGWATLLEVADGRGIETTVA